MRNLKYMKKFYNEYKNNEVVQQVVAQLPWGHNIVLMDKINDINIRKIYAEAIIRNGWSRSVLSAQIETEFHKRIGNIPKDILEKLPTEEDINLHIDIND